MAHIPTLILLVALLMSVSQSEDLWMLVMKQSAKRSGTPGKRLWTLSTPTTLSCAALCLQKHDCWFFGYQDHVCQTYTSSGSVALTSDTSSVMQGKFRRYRRKAGQSKVSMKRHNERRSYPQALHVCQSEGGTLVKLDSERKEKLFTQAVKPTSKLERFWIGLTDRYDNDTWYWTDGTVLGRYRKWDHGEPNNLYKGKIENCAAKHVGAKYIFQGSVWYDASCSREYKFVCEFV